MDMMSYLMGKNSGGGGKGAKIEVVTELPEIGEANVIYLVPKQDEDENNVFDEYLYINDEWELIGSTAIDISGKQDTMQFSTMPNASADYLGKIVQYTGTTDSNYTNGYFYVCVGTTENDVTTYSWSNVEVQDSASEYSANSIFINTGNRSGNDFGDIIHGKTTLSVFLNADEKGQLTEFLQSMYDGNKDMFSITIGGDYMFLGQNRALSMTVSPQYLTGRRLSEKPTQMDCYSVMTSCEVNNDQYMCKYRLNFSLTWDGDIVSVVSAFCKCGAALEFITSNAVQRDYLRKNNTTSYTPTGDYNPATKKYVDDSIATAITTTLGGSF